MVLSGIKRLAGGALPTSAAGSVPQAVTGIALHQPARTSGSVAALSPEDQSFRGPRGPGTSRPSAPLEPPSTLQLETYKRLLPTARRLRRQTLPRGGVYYYRHYPGGVGSFGGSMEKQRGGGGRSEAAIFTVRQSYRRVENNPWVYLDDILERLSTTASRIIRKVVWKLGLGGRLSLGVQTIF